jgi:hypothetical protein
MLQLIFLVLKFTGMSVLGVNISEWSIIWLISPVILYVALKYLYGLSDGLSNILNWLTRVALIGGFLYLIYYILTI